MTNFDDLLREILNNKIIYQFNMLGIDKSIFPQDNESGYTCIDSFAPCKVAMHLSIIDCQLFSKITDEELLSVNWNKPNKETEAPNIHEITYQFNNISCLTIWEILNKNSPKSRATMIKYFIKVLKELFDLHSINSMKAILSALECYPIHRLRKTFALLSRKHNDVLSEYRALFSEQNNWERLRDHQRKCPLPCVPFLGLYLTDLTFLDTAFGLQRSSESDREKKMNGIIEAIHRFQTSTYDIRYIDYELYDFLKRRRYVEDLRKKIDDQFYKRSLFLEPPMSPQPEIKTPPQKYSHKSSKSDVTGSTGISFVSACSSSQFGKSIFYNDIKTQLVNCVKTDSISSESSLDLQTNLRKRPKYLEKCQDLRDVVCEGFLRLQIHSFKSEHVPPKKKKVWLVLTHDQHLLHFLYKINMTLSSVFGNQKKPLFCVLEIRNTQLITSSDNENGFMLASNNHECIFSYTAETIEEAQLWKSNLINVIDTTKNGFDRLFKPETDL